MGASGAATHRPWSVIAAVGQNDYWDLVVVDRWIREERPALSSTRTWVCRDLQEMEDILPAWRRLYGATGGNPFLTPDWTLAWLGRAEPFIVTLFQNDELVAVLPLSRVRRRLEFVEGDAYGFLALGDRNRAAALLVGAVAAAREDWDTLVMNELRDDAATTSALREACAANGLVWRDVVSSKHPFAVLDGPTAAYEEVAGRKVLYEIKRRQRKLSALGAVAFHRLTREEDVLRYFDDIVALHRKRWEDRMDTSAFGDATRTAAMRDAAVRFARAGIMALDVALVDGLLVAYSYGFRDGGRYVHYSPGFDPAFAPFAVSKMLLSWQLSESRREGLHEFDFSRGEEPYKLEWATGVRTGRFVVVGHDGLRSTLASERVLKQAETIAWLKSDPRLVHFKRVSLGRIRHHVSFPFLRQQAWSAVQRVDRTIGDRGVVGTVRALAERAFGQKRGDADIFACDLPRTPPEVPANVTVTVLRPGEYEALAATGRYDRTAVVLAHYRGAQCYVARVGGALAAYAWMTIGKSTFVPELHRELEVKADQAYIFDCYTLRAFRGAGLYPLVLRVALANATGCTRAFIVAEQSNVASRRGIEKAGFLPLPVS